MARTFWKTKCHGHKTNGEPCPNWAMDHQQVCTAHGGRAGQNKRAADVRRLIDKKGRKVKDAPPVDDPYEERARINGRLVAVQDILWNELEAGNTDRTTVTGNEEPPPVWPQGADSGG